MSSFEYITVLISIVLGLGITQILKGVAELIKKSHKVILYWPHILWILFVLLLLIQEWWLLYELKNYHPWRLPFFLFVMLYPINLYLLANLLIPKQVRGEDINLKHFYFSNYRKLFLLLILSAFISVLYNIFILHLKPGDQLLQLVLVLGISIITLKRITTEWVHKLIAVTVLLALLAAIGIEWNVWLID